MRCGCDVHVEDGLGGRIGKVVGALMVRSWMGIYWVMGALEV